MTRVLHATVFALAAVALASLPSYAKKAPTAAPAAPQATAPGNEPLDFGQKFDPNHDTNGVAAIVNDTVISQYDLRQRVALFVATSGVKPTEDSIKEIRSQVLQTLETERLELLEAQKNNITVSSGDVDKAIANIMKDNGLSDEQLKQMLGRAGVHMTTLRGQIAAQIAWSKVVQDQYGDRVNITPEDVSDELNRLNQGKDKTHYLVSEVFQAVDTPEDDAKILKSMQDLEVQMKSGAPFGAVARQFSQNPTAASGGDLGMVIDGQLPKPLNDALKDMRPGMVTNPIRSAGGYYILYLRGRQEGVGTKIDDTPKVDPHPDSLPLARLLLPLGPKPTKEIAEKVLNVAGAIRTHIENCEMMPTLAKQIKGAIYMSLGTMRISELSPEMQQALSTTTGGDVTLPFLSSAGVELIARCDKGPPPKLSAFKIPSRDDIEQQLFQDRIGVLSREYLRDLRRNADVETR